MEFGKKGLQAGKVYAKMLNSFSKSPDQKKDLSDQFLFSESIKNTKRSIQSSFAFSSCRQTSLLMMNKKTFDHDP
jgi:hypothetical protein